MLEFNEFELYLIRHGQSVVNAIPDQMGQTPYTQLTDHGKHQAKLLRERLEKQQIYFDFAYSSTYSRALNTAEIVLAYDPDMLIVTSPDIREYSAGNWEGSKRSEVITNPVAVKMGLLANAFQPPGGESLHQVERRASAWLEREILYNDDIKRFAKIRHEAKLKIPKIAVFSHGMTIKCLLHYIMGFDQSFTWKLTLENTSITKLVFGEEGWRLITINDHSHLL